MLFPIILKLILMSEEKIQCEICQKAFTRRGIALHRERCNQKGFELNENATGPLNELFGITKPMLCSIFSVLKSLFFLDFTRIGGWIVVYVLFYWPLALIAIDKGEQYVPIKTLATSFYDFESKLAKFYVSFWDGSNQEDLCLQQYNRDIRNFSNLYRW